MCGICGCGKTDASLLAQGLDRAHDHRHGPGLHAHAQEHADAHEHAHAHERAGAHEHPHDHARSALRTDAPGPAEGAHRARIVRVERDILEKNDRLAATNRRLFEATRTLALNLVSSPGAGKTALLVRTLTDLRDKLPLAVIEGDQQTSLDADRISATGAPALQINTGSMCHLDASMIADALERIRIPADGVLFIENVGNLVCPAGFNLGEAGKVVLASVTEGEDKPLKYPNMFRAAALVLVTKVDLLPHLDFDVAALEANARTINPRAAVLRLSTRTGEGLDAWYGWIDARRREVGGR